MEFVALTVIYVLGSLLVGLLMAIVVVPMISAEVSRAVVDNHPLTVDLDANVRFVGNVRDKIKSEIRKKSGGVDIPAFDPNSVLKLLDDRGQIEVTEVAIALCRAIIHSPGLYDFIRAKAAPSTAVAVCTLGIASAVASSSCADVVQSLRAMINDDRGVFVKAIAGTIASIDVQHLRARPLKEMCLAALTGVCGSIMFVVAVAVTAPPTILHALVGAGILGLLQGAAHHEICLSKLNYAKATAERTFQAQYNDIVVRAFANNLHGLTYAVVKCCTVDLISKKGRFCLCKFG